MILQRTLALKHTQYVMKQDVPLVYKYLMGQADVAPKNVKKIEVMKAQTESNSEYFSDRGDIIDEGYIIPTGKKKSSLKKSELILTTCNIL